MWSTKWGHIYIYMGTGEDNALVSDIFSHIQFLVATVADYFYSLLISFIGKVIQTKFPLRLVIEPNC